MTTIVAVPHVVWLKPRPLARTPSSFPLLPLLPPRPALKHLPPEVWIQILENAFAFYRPKHASEHAQVIGLRVGLLLISKDIHVSNSDLQTTAAFCLLISCYFTRTSRSRCSTRTSMSLHCAFSTSSRRASTPPISNGTPSAVFRTPRPDGGSNLLIYPLYD